MILPVLFVYAVTRAFWWTTTQPWFFSSPLWVEGALKLALWVPQSILLVMVLRGISWRDTLGELGLTAPAWQGTALVSAATLPMAAMVASAWDAHLNLHTLVAGVVLGPIAEEVLYRGFLFQQLWHRARWPVWAAALGSALIFALAHHQNLDEKLALGLLRNDLAAPLSAIGPPLAATVAGGCLFAWITWRWRSLWPAIALHAAINFWWDIAPSRGTDAATAAVAQGIALALVVIVTWVKTSNRGRSSAKQRR